MAKTNFRGFNNSAVNDNKKNSVEDYKLSLRTSFGLIMVAAIVLWAVIWIILSTVGLSLPSFSLPEF
jgi:hypothetical protein